jgi:hypothetical protein
MNYTQATIDKVTYGYGTWEMHQYRRSWLQRTKKSKSWNGIASACKSRSSMATASKGNRLPIHRTFAPLMTDLTSTTSNMQIAEAMGEHIPEPSRADMVRVFQLCRGDDWRAVLRYVETNPWLAVTPMIMDNHISTTVIHQAITSKGNTADRATLILAILSNTPQAAAIKNGYGSLPLHVIAQRNTKMNAQTKEKLIFELVKAHTGALVEEGGVGKRTPLHIIFTGTYELYTVYDTPDLKI